MKILEPRLIQEYRCDFCNTKFRSKYYCELHEDKCYKNPNRNCPVCENNGSFDDGNLWGEMRDCYACERAKEMGGKSYI